jgi:hypothetical protein
MPLTALDRYWWDVGRSYLEHASACVQRWLVADGHRDLAVLPYYQWRRDEDDVRFGRTPARHAPVPQHSCRTAAPPNDAPRTGSGSSTPPGTPSS